jgi:hypothetical protein
LQGSYAGVDTASVYANESEVGKSLSCRTRDELFVQTKLWRSHQGSQEAVSKALTNSLRQLNQEYVDLWLMHWPGPGRHLHLPPVRKAKPVWTSGEREEIGKNGETQCPAEWTPAMRLETWAHMANETKGDGARACAIGVCNFSARQLRELIAFCDAEKLPLPAVVQVRSARPCAPLRAPASPCEPRLTLSLRARARLALPGRSLARSPPAHPPFALAPLAERVPPVPAGNGGPLRVRRQGHRVPVLRRARIRRA